VRQRHRGTSRAQSPVHLTLLQGSVERGVSGFRDGSPQSSRGVIPSEKLDAALLDAASTRKFSSPNVPMEAYAPVCTTRGGITDIELSSNRRFQG